MQSVRELVGSIIESEQGLTLEIAGPSGESVGTLVAITGLRAQDPKLAAQLSAWRNASRRWFLTQFQATPEGTLAWLTEVVAPDSTRILFLICDSDSRPVGHIGLRGLSDTQAELDNLLRGEMAGHPQLVEYAERELLRWTFEVLGVRAVICNNLASNPLVLRLHESIGFRNSARIPLTRHETGEGVALVPGLVGASSPDNLYIQQMELTREAFMVRDDA